MSYEGHFQCICENRHYTEPEEDYSCRALKCPICKAKLVFLNPVDDTNGDGFGHIQREVFESTLGLTSTAERHIMVNRLPTEEEIEGFKKARCVLRKHKWEFLNEVPLPRDDQ